MTVVVVIMFIYTLEDEKITEISLSRIKDFAKRFFFFSFLPSLYQYKIKSTSRGTQLIAIGKPTVR